MKSLRDLVRDKLRLKSSEISWMKLFKNINTVKAGNGNRAWKKKQEEQLSNSEGS